MQLVQKLRIKSQEKIIHFLNEEHVGRIATIDAHGYPQVIPMNFVFYNNSIYMHSHTKGEKLDNIKANTKSGFEVDRELEFLPSYFSSPTDASLADTLYISVIIKGESTIVSDPKEKTGALNALMQKYQPEGRYTPLTLDMQVLKHVAVIKLTPNTMQGKYKIGQHLSSQDRLKLAWQIYEKNGMTQHTKDTLKIMGYEITTEGKIQAIRPKQNSSSSSTTTTTTTTNDYDNNAHLIW